MRSTLLFCFVSALSLVGCQPDTATVTAYDNGVKTAFDGELVVGEKVDVKVSVHHPEIEGSTDLHAESLETSDPSIVRTEIGGQGFYLIAVSPGVATIHATTDGFPSADFMVSVKAK